MSFEKLIEGFQQFKAEYIDKNVYEELAAKGQSPHTLIVACCDSRNDPAMLTQSGPGEIFVVRNVAALIPPYQPDGHYHGTSAAIEFAVKAVKVKNIIVLGHALCGGALALAAHKDETDYEFVSQWMSMGAKARDAVEKELKNADPQVRLRALEQSLVLTSINNLFTFPWVSAAIDAGELTVHGWYFDMINGELLNYDFKEGAFVKISAGAEGLSKLQAGR